MIRRTVEQLVEPVRERRQLLQAVGIDRGFEPVGIMGLERQGGDEGDEIGIAAALADAVQRALNLADAGLYSRQRIGDRLAGVVMGVDAEPVSGHAAGNDRLHDRADLVGLRAAIRVAEHHPARAGLMSRAGAGERIGGIGLVAVEEMLAIDHGLAAADHHGLDRGADGCEVLFVRTAERHADMIVPAFRHETDGVALRLQQRAQARIVGGGLSGTARHAEGHEAGRPRASLCEEGRIGRIGAGITALDIIHAETIEHVGDRNLFLEREIDAGRLLAVAQGRVEEEDALLGGAHDWVFPA